MLTSPRQLSLGLWLPNGRPMFHLKAVVTILDLREDDVLALIETGELSWAWDIRSRDAERRDVRVWRDSVLSFLDSKRVGHSVAHPFSEPVTPTQNGLPKRVGHSVATGHQALTEDKVLSSLFPHSGAEILSTEVQRMFSASQDHIRNLVQQELLAALNAYSRGPYGYVRISRASVLTFLRSRRIC